jgi:aarF domain-containing kinase
MYPIFADPSFPGIFIKLGQHMASLVVLPQEWTRTMAVLQDKCEPTAYEDLETMFLHDMGAPIGEIFDDFDPNPIGVASLAQVHVGFHKASGTLVAIKVGRTFVDSFKAFNAGAASTSTSCRVL